MSKSGWVGKLAAAVALVAAGAIGAKWFAPYGERVGSMRTQSTHFEYPGTQTLHTGVAENGEMPAQSDNIDSRMDIGSAVKNIVAQSSQFEQFAAAYPLALNADARQLQGLIEGLLSLEKSEPQSIGIARIFYQRYVDIDAESAARHFWSHVAETSTQFRRLMFNIYHEWAWLDIDASLSDITTNVDPAYREDLIVYLLRDDHFTTSETLATLAQSYSERTRTEAALIVATRESNEAAFARLMAMPPNSDARRSGLYRLVKLWAQQDPRGALMRISQLKHSGDRQNLLINVIGIWAQTDAEQALVAALSIDKGSNLAYAALSTLAKRDGLRALSLAESYKDRLDDRVRDQVLQSWASADPKAAAQYVEQLGSGQTAKLARQIAWHYTLQYPEEAYRWAQRLGLLGDHNLASHMGNALAQSDLSKAEEIFAQLPPSSARSGLFANIVRQRLQGDIADAYRWLADYRGETGYTDAMNGLLYSWSRRDPQTASDIILSLEDDPNRVAHLSSVAGNWYDRSEEQALRWVYSLPEGTTRDRVIASLAQKVGRTDLDQARRIAEEIGDQALRDSLLEQLEQRSKG